MNDLDKKKLGYADGGYGKYGYGITNNYCQRAENYYVQADFEKEELTHFQKLTEKKHEICKKNFQKIKFIQKKCKNILLIKKKVVPLQPIFDYNKNNKKDI
ncbi:MAG: hypothetical protein LBS50_09625 [Prevotellaceae bacterium]|nr:hypothetical protein [Prevotellaceae bacterium]